MNDKQDKFYFCLGKEIIMNPCKKHLYRMEKELNVFDT